VTGREEHRAAELEDERAPGRKALLAGVEQAAVGAEAVALGEDGVSRLGGEVGVQSPLAERKVGEVATTMSTGPGTGSSRSPSRTTTRWRSPWRRTFSQARATAAGLASVAHTRTCGARAATATASAPDPVPTSATVAGLSPTRASAISTSRSLASRGVMTPPGRVPRAKPQKRTCPMKAVCDAGAAVLTGEAPERPWQASSRRR